MQIYTASWFAKLPPDVTRIGISRGTPRGQPAGFRLLRELNPGLWFRSATLDQYVPLYGDILATLNPHVIRDQIHSLSSGRDKCALLCYERADDIHKGEDFCHRHLAAKWLEDRLGISVPEFDFPGLDRFAALKARGISVPSYG